MQRSTAGRPALRATETVHAPGHRGIEVQQPCSVQQHARLAHAWTPAFTHSSRGQRPSSPPVAASSRTCLAPAAVQPSKPRAAATQEACSLTRGGVQQHVRLAVALQQRLQPVALRALYRAQRLVCRGGGRGGESGTTSGRAAHTGAQAGARAQPGAGTASPCGGPGCRERSAHLQHIHVERVVRGAGAAAARPHAQHHVPALRSYHPVQEARGC